MRRRNLLALAPVALLLTGCDIDDVSSWGSSDRFKEDFHLNYKVKPGGTLAIDTFNGSIEISSWEKEEVDVNGIKSCSSEEMLRQLKVEGDQQGNVLRLRAVRPEGKRGGCGAKFIVRLPKRMLLDGIVTSNSSIRVENMLGDARLQSSNGSVKVRGLEGKLEAKTSNASIELSDVQGDFVGRTSNGSINVDHFEGSFDATTSNAHIRAEITKMPEGRIIKADSSNGNIELSLPDYKGQAVDVETSNSSITLRLPNAANFDVRASTSNSNISSDFDVTTSGTIGKHRLEGKVGKGGGPVRVNTSNGSIRLQKL